MLKIYHINPKFQFSNINSDIHKVSYLFKYKITFSTSVKVNNINTYINFQRNLPRNIKYRTSDINIMMRPDIVWLK